MIQKSTFRAILAFQVQQIERHPGEWCVCAGRYLVAGGRDRTPDGAAATCEGVWLDRRGAAAAGRRVVVPGVVLVHDPGKVDLPSDCLAFLYLFFFPRKKKYHAIAVKKKGTKTKSLDSLI